MICAIEGPEIDNQGFNANHKKGVRQMRVGEQA